MAETPSTSPFQALEEMAYHAYREWPIWLVLRERDLAAHLKTSSPSPTEAPSQNPQTAVAYPDPTKGA